MFELIIDLHAHTEAFSCDSNLAPGDVIEEAK
jgi:hypothetical protein